MPLLSALLAVHAYSAPLAGPAAVTRAAAGSITMGGNQKVVGRRWRHPRRGAVEIQLRRPPIKLLSRLNEIKLLTAVSEAGLLSGAEEAGVFSKLEGGRLLAHRRRRCRSSRSSGCSRRWRRRRRSRQG